MLRGSTKIVTSDDPYHPHSSVNFKIYRHFAYDRTKPSGHANKPSPQYVVYAAAGTAFRDATSSFTKVSQLFGSEVSRTVLR